ncbi:MAG TPA: hypothetical protein PL078_02135 [Bacillota bacterium]|nr:hypothetical protein [Peptococcaceae bacterium MAG4]NLW38602.1 hypothetical protein [Peptococcaceae bacterium]HPZ42779.1 hypothetical protein [Bacillota bacterium]HQD75344.1 hypothetical protein [Bacillota bacterium]HUM58064.1 hypothetical protein [Bacillota bacterium]
MIRYLCECGNDDPNLFDVYVSQGDLCDILTVVCKQCGDIREDLVACNRGSILLKHSLPNSA